MPMTDFPSMSTILPGKLFLGNIYDSQDQMLLDDMGVTAVLNLCHTAPVITTNRTYHWRPLNDGSGNSDADFKQAVDMLDDLLRDGEVVMVHCQAGVSRSATVVATWMAKHYFGDGMFFDQSADILAKMRPIILPHYELRKLARRFLGEINDQYPY